MQKYRADEYQRQDDDAILWYAKWLGGPSLSKIAHCRWESLHTQYRPTVYITGEPDTAFSQPAVCSYKGKRVRGYVTGDDSGNLVFRGANAASSFT